MLNEFFQQGLEAEMKEYTQSLPLTQFIEETSPVTKGTVLPILGEKLVTQLAQSCSPDIHNNFGIIRGGSMRSFLLDTHRSDHLLAGIFKNPDPTLIGDDKLAKRTVEKVFGEPKDIDVLLIYNGLNTEAARDDFLFMEIIRFFQGIQFTGYMKTGSQVDLFHQNYQVELIKHQHQGQTLVKVNIKDKGIPVLKFHFGLIPQEKGKDIRFYDTAADGDLTALGFLSRGMIKQRAVNKEDSDVTVRYFAKDGITHFDAQMTHCFFDPLAQPLVPFSNEPLPQTLTSNLREINFRIAYLTEMISSPEKLNVFILSQSPNFAQYFRLPFMKLLIQTAIQHDYKKPDTLDIFQWILNSQEQIKESTILFDSDFYYGLTVNPFLFFLFAFPKNIFLPTPLREIFSDPHKVVGMLESIARKFEQSTITNTLIELSAGYLEYIRKNPRHTATYQITEWLINQGYLSNYTPITLSSLFQCTNPLNLKTLLSQED